MDISLINVNGSYKRVTSAHFSELLRCLMLLKNNPYAKEAHVGVSSSAPLQEGQAAPNRPALPRCSGILWNPSFGGAAGRRVHNGLSEGGPPGAQPSSTCSSFKQALLSTFPMNQKPVCWGGDGREQWRHSRVQNNSPCLQEAHCLAAAAAVKSIQSCPTLCDPIDGSPLGSSVPGILQARTLEWVAISFSNAWKWNVKLLSRARLLATLWTGAYQAPPSMGFSRQEYWSGVPLPSPYCLAEETNS